MDSFLKDLRYGWRVLLKAPGFSAVAVLTLAIGIGANTAIFSVVDAVLLRPLAVAQPDRVMLLQESWREQNGVGMSVGNFSDIRSQSNSFEKVSASAAASFNLATQEAPERIDGEQVSSDYFETFGVAPLRGRFFSAEENQRGHHRVAILSERLWRTRFQEDPQIIGQQVRINGEGFVVVGIMPASFDPALLKSDLWVPAAFLPEQLADHDNHYLLAFARLKPGVTRAQAQAEMNVIAVRQQQRYPIDDKERGFTLTPLAAALLGDQGTTMYAILAAVGFVLLIACANIANLQLARARSRRKEIAVRVALGATPQRIVRQLLAENFVLAAASAILGILLANWGLTWLLANGPANVPRLDQAHLDSAALAFACAAALFSGLLFGLAPAMRAASVKLAEAFKEGVGTSSGARDHMRSVLVVAEIALALVLLVGAGLLVRSALLVAKVNPGFDTSNLTVGRIGLPDAAYKEPVHARQTFERMVDAVQALPGVQSAALVSRAPLGGGSSNGLLAEGKPFDPSYLVDASLRIVTPSYLSTTHVPLVTGRNFTAGDTRDKPLVVLVNQTLARTLWPGQDPLGKRFACCEAGPKGRLDPVWHQVVGVVGDVRAWGLDQQVRPEFYMPLEQMPPSAWDWIGRTMDLVIRSQNNAVSTAELRSTVAGIAPGVPIYRVSTMQQKVSGTLEQSHFDTFLMGLFAATALLLSCVGVYGVLSYIVAQHTREIGIRMALGASQGRVVRDVLAQGARLAGAGVLAGAIGALAATRLLAAMLYGVRPTDAITFVLVSLLLLGVALLASYLPARRASRVDPMVALRYE